jgi:hypothetical protein
MRLLITLALAAATAGCYNRHVNGTRIDPSQQCDGEWVAIVVNNTNRIYDLYVGTRLVGSADARTTTRIRLDPALGRVTPSYRESATTREQQGPRITSSAIRTACE